MCNQSEAPVLQIMEFKKAGLWSTTFQEAIQTNSQCLEELFRSFGNRDGDKTIHKLYWKPVKKHKMLATHLDVNWGAICTPIRTEG